MLHKLIYISQGISASDHVKNIQTVLNAGVKLVQLRLKNITEEMYVDVGYMVKELCDKYNALLTINDNATVAKLCNSAALHLGLDDMNITEAKRILPNKIIGGTANTFEHIQQRCAEKVDYIGLGPYRFTTTKEKLSPVLGIEGYRNIIHKMKSKNLTTPIYAIGGIEIKDIESIANTGIYGIAVSGLLTHSNNKEHLVKEINKILYHA